MTANYTDRELDSLFREVNKDIKELRDRFAPFEKDIRESLSRVEINVLNIEVRVDERLRQERALSDKKYAPIILWTGFLGLMALFAALIIPKILALFFP